MKVLWICGLPRGVRQTGLGHQSELSWVVGHFPPPEGVELHILCPVLGLESLSESFVSCGATWHLVNLKRWEPIFLRRRFWWGARKVVREIDPDVVHGWGGETGWGLLATYFSRQAVVSVQGLLRMLGEAVRRQSLAVPSDERGVGYWMRCWLEGMTYRRAKICLCESETARRELKRLYGVDGKVVPQPLRKEFVEPRRSEGVEGSGITRFLFVGQDVARKGIQDVREAFLRLPASARLKSELTVITGGKSAAEIAELMRTHDVFVLPSYGDTGPTAIKEALAMGMPVIAYDNTGPKELLEKYGGTLVKTGDVCALAVAMEKSLAISHRALGIAERVRQDLSREIVWKELLEVYEGAMR